MRFIGGVSLEIVQDIILEILWRIEVLVDRVYLRNEGAALFIRIANSSKPIP